MAAFLLFVDAIDEGKVTQLHHNPHTPETFYMLEGDLRLHIAGVEQSLAAVGIAIIPGGVPHAFMVTTPTARMRCLQTPGGGESFYRQASDPAGVGDPPEVDFTRVRAAAATTGAIEILGRHRSDRSPHTGGRARRFPLDHRVRRVGRACS